MLLQCLGPHPLAAHLLESHSLLVLLQLWAFSRDSLMPGSKYMRQLDKISQTPALASECCSERGSAAQVPGPQQLQAVPCC